MRQNQNIFTIFEEARRLYLQEGFDEAREQMAVYRQSVDYESFPKQDKRPQKSVHSSVIIVSFNADLALMQCLESVFKQTDTGFEVILIDNGGNEAVRQQLADFPMLWVSPPINLLPSEGRNVGAHFAWGDRLIFLDDDATMDSEYVSNAREAMENHDFLAIRGRILPSVNPPKARPPLHYDLGVYPLPAVLITEGNMVIQKQAFVSVGGFDPLLFGHEGVELTSRCLQKFPNKGIYYWPKLLIYHDFVSAEKLEAKKARQTLAKKYIKKVSPLAGFLSEEYLIWYSLRPEGSAVEPVSSKNGKGATDGVSIIIRAGEDIRSVKKFLGSFVRYNTHKPVEILMPAAQPQEALSVIKPFIPRVLIRLLPPEIMSAQAPMSKIAKTARYGKILFLDESAVFESDVLPKLLECLFSAQVGFIGSKSDGANSDQHKILSPSSHGLLNSLFFLCNKALMVVPSVENLPANIAVYDLLEHFISVKKDITTPVGNIVDDCRSLTINDNLEYIKLINNAIKTGRPPVKEKIIAGMATIPSRLNTLPQVLERLKPQFDRIYVYLNGHEEVPECVQQDNISYAWSKNHGDLAAAGKFFFLPEAKNGYYFSLDDDFLYPDDYSYKMVTTLKKYNDRVPVCVHGSIFGEPLEWYFERIAVFGSRTGLEQDRFVTLAGTGTLAFHCNSINLNFSDFSPTPMCDLQVSIKARKNDLPIVALAREKNWLQLIEEDASKNAGLDYWNRMLIDDKGRTETAKKFNWGFDYYKQIILKLMNQIYPKIDRKELDEHLFDTDFIVSAESYKVPNNWNPEVSFLFYTRKYQYLLRSLKILNFVKQYSKYPDLQKLFPSKKEVLIPVETKDVAILKEKTSKLLQEIRNLEKENENKMSNNILLSLESL
ncbi:MAG: glycosyltransferase [Okeania sp. SIO2C2]|uniref:glycosyltransferase family 2 protein n=1 Tax=Okeania sp. SIO2C2 TaxID=2607787 RepID=UPI0013B8A2C2|nr:glycosyltransferase [Okeania sp. SIO2C2]NEP91298.1 glycosyltransferase [Okeania sp. SIO2C2]